MSVEINDQKLIDIVYVDDEDNKHKYSGPFINDLTITSEIQEKLTALDTLNTQIGELKTKWDNLTTDVTNNSGIDLIQYMMDLPTGVASGVNNVYVLPPEDSCPIGISLVQSPFTFNIGWLDLNKKDSNNANDYDIKYLGIGKHVNDNFDPEQEYFLQFHITDKLPTDPTKFTSWENITPEGYTLTDLNSVVMYIYLENQDGTVNPRENFTLWKSYSEPVGPIIRNFQVDTLTDILNEKVFLHIRAIFGTNKDAGIDLYKCYLGFKSEE